MQTDKVDVPEELTICMAEKRPQRKCADLGKFAQTLPVSA